MRKVSRSARTTEDREKLEEKLKAAEATLALLEQFGVPVNSTWTRAISKARKQLNVTKSAF